MVDDTVLSFEFPAVGRKKVTAAFDGGRLTSDGGVMLLSLAERRLGIAERLARLIPDRRDPTRVIHSFADMIRARIFAICCGYEDCDDLDALHRSRLQARLRTPARHRGRPVLAADPVATGERPTPSRRDPPHLRPGGRLDGLLPARA